ncbi:peripheral-type benzodiazepine receptor-associated protein 1 isoform X8 [Alligator mississippiensis]|uniref:peripheral-type benzodiazepine receptor-associated protein 1 isoform X8 n=1 Tax=Alligator mississippiensis TaxID=8496 RepID=UPI0028774C6F|nr:peripheral-type benzodiazepine receptor-associated protein 1 isoform X8 [Alligator mississippiensis]
MEKQEEMKSHADLVQVSAWQSCLSGHGSLVPGAPAVQDTVLVTDLQEDGVPLGDSGSRVALHLTPEVPEAGLEEVRHQSILVIAQEGCLWTPGQQNQPVQSLENINPRCVMEGLEHNPMDGSPKNGADYSCLVKQNIKLLSALEELQHRCTSLKEENSLLRKSCFPETEEKVKHLKRKNAELAVIAKRLEERARKLQEANLKVVNAPVAVKGSSLELCKKAFARQRTKDLTEQASALLAKDKQIEALQQECWELQAKLTSGKEGHHCLNLIDFDHLLRESQKEVLRLQRQIALKNFKESLHSSKSSSEGSSSTAAMCLGPSVPMPNACIKDSSKGAQLGKLTLATEVHRKVEPGVLPLGHTCVELENFPLKNALADQEDSQQREQLEFELRKKRKKCENLEHEVRKKHKRCKELELQLEEVQSENVRLAEQNSRLNEKAEWAGQVESENADLKLQVVLVTKERDSAIQTSQGLQTKLENLEQVLKHMRDVAERRQKLEVEHEEALLVLREKQEEVRRLQQAQAEAKREHEGAVQLLEARVRDLEDQCRSQTEQFSLLSQELKHFRLQTGKIDLLTSTLVTCDLPLAPCSSTPQPQGVHWEKDPDVAPASPVLQCTKTTNDEGTGELEPLPQVSDPAPSVTKTPLPSAGASQKPAKKMESQSSSSKSESVQNSPKSCPTPEVDTASEMEELDVDSVSLIPEPGNQGPAKLQVFLARYSYNPFDGPNENPEAELPLTAGEYIYIYGDMDEDGFFEGIPDAPLDVQVELGPSPGILVISWLPVTIDAEGSSNGVRVTGYAVYADGRKVMEVTSPTAGSVLVDLSQLQMFQVCQEVSVRTMSVYGESVDSVPAQISSSLLKASSHFSPPQSAVSTNSTSKLLCGESRYSLPVQTPVTYQTAPPFPPQKVSTDAKFTIYTTSSCEGSMDSLPEKMSPCLHPSSPSASSMQVTGTLSSVSDASREEECLTDLSQSASSMFPAGMSEEELTASRNPAVKGSGEDSQAEVMVELFVMKNLELESQTNTSNMKVPVETCQACFAEEWLKESTTERRREGTEKCLSPEPQLSSSSAKLGEDSYRDLGASGSCVQELLGMSPGKKLMKEISRGDSSVTVPRVKREQEEKMSEAGRRQLNILAEHSRSSDLSDILEEEEEELCSDVLEEKWDLKEHCSRENGEKQEPCDTDSDEEILERILELPLQKNCSKKLFSIPEVTEEEDEGEEEEEEEEEEKQAQVEEKEPQDYFLERLPYHAGKEEVPIPTVTQQPFPKTDDSDIYQNLPGQAPQEESILQDRGEDTDNENPGSPEPSWGQKRGSCNWSYQESSMRPTTGASPLWGKRKGGSYQERAHDRPEATRKRQSDAREHCSRLLSNCSQTGGSLYRVQSLREKLNVISAGGKDGQDTGSHMRQGSFRKSHRKLASSRLAESASMASHCISSRSLEIDIEYDSEEEQDPTFSPMRASQLWPNCRVEGPQAHHKEWSVCSSPSEPALSSSRRELNRQEPVEDKGAEWAGSSSHCSQFPSREKETPRSVGSSEEQGWELECKLPSLRRKPEHPRKGSHSASLHTRASGNGDPRSQELPGLPSWQTSTRKGSKNLRSQVLKPPISSTDATRNEASEATVKEDSVRIFVALFDYDPVSMSPNPDAAEEELPFKEGQILKVCGDKDADGFYRGECAGKAGYIPCNMVSEVQVENNDMKKQLLKQGYIPPGTSMESVGNGTFSPPPRRLTVPPPKPRRSKKAELGKQENYKSHPTENYRPRSVHKCQDLEAELLVPRSMVAVFDYNPKESSPNADVEGLELSWLTSKAELTFSAGDIITVFGSMDDDGFYYGELNRQRGLVPSNFLEAVSLDGGVSEGLHSKDKDACAVSVESQLNLDGPGDLSANTFEVPPSCPVTGVPSPEQVVFETPESSVLPVQTKKKRGFFFKGKQLFRKLGSSKKN